MLAFDVMTMAVTPTPPQTAKEGQPGKKRQYYLRVAADNDLPVGHLIVGASAD